MTKCHFQQRFFVSKHEKVLFDVLMVRRFFSCSSFISCRHQYGRENKNIFHLVLASCNLTTIRLFLISQLKERTFFFALYKSKRRKWRSGINTKKEAKLCLIAFFSSFSLFFVAFGWSCNALDYLFSLQNTLWAIGLFLSD